MDTRAFFSWAWRGGMTRAGLAEMVLRSLVVMVAAAVLCGTDGLAQMTSGPVGFAGCKPLSERTGEAGCWIVKTRAIGRLSAAPVFWTLDRFQTQADAEKAATETDTMVQALGAWWVFRVGPKEVAARGGERMSQVGPLPVTAGAAYSVQFMEAILPPGAMARTHRHAGPEAFYTEAGESCLETPRGKQIGRKGVDVIVPEGEPMSLMSSGRETRRSIVLVLYRSDQPWMTMAEDWTPTGLCRSGGG